MQRHWGAWVWRVVVALLVAGVAGCGAGIESDEETLGTAALAVTGGGFSTAALKLETSLNACAANVAQDYFNVVNTGTSNVTLSDIKIKLWVDDTSVSNVVAAINYGGCLNNATGCYKQVTGVTASASRFSPACGPDANHQANWEITVSTSDHSLLKPGEAWKGVQAALRLANYANFNPGSSKWYSPCGAATSYAVRPHFGLYHQNLPVFSSDTGVNAPDCKAAHGTQHLTGHVPVEVTTAPLVGPVPASTTVRLTVGMPLRNASALANVVSQVSNPSSPTYRHYLTPEAVAATYGPTVANYDSLKAWAQSVGLTLGATYSHRLVLDVSGSAAAVQKALYVSLNYYKRPDGTTFYAPDREPSVDLATTLLHVSGLDNVRLPQPRSYLGPGTVEGTDLRKAYVSNVADSSCPDPNTLLGDGQCIGIIADNPVYAEDIQMFVDRNALPVDVGKQVQMVSVNGASTARPGGGSLLELDADIEMSLAMAPHAEIVVYVGHDGRSYASSLAAMASNAQHPICRQLSISWALDSDPNNAQLLGYVLPSQGQSVFYASGDDGALRFTDTTIPGVDTSYNYAYNYLTQVGATSLASSGSDTYTEGVWVMSAGGFSNVVPQPWYQAGLNFASFGGSSIGQNFPDVGAQGDQTVTLTTTISSPPPEGQCTSDTPTLQVIHAGGTSLSAPIWAGFMALANQLSASNGYGSVGYANPLIYSIGTSSSYGSSFTDVQTGSSKAYKFGNADPCGGPSELVENGPGFDAIAGFDLVSGWGSPKCGLLSKFAASASGKMSTSVHVVGTVTEKLTDGSNVETTYSKNYDQTLTLNNVGEAEEVNLVLAAPDAPVPGLAGATLRLELNATDVKVLAEYFALGQVLVVVGTDGTAPLIHPEVPETIFNNLDTGLTTDYAPYVHGVLSFSFTVTTSQNW